MSFRIGEWSRDNWGLNSPTSAVVRQVIANATIVFSGAGTIILWDHFRVNKDYICLYSGRIIFGTQFRIRRRYLGRDVVRVNWLCRANFLLGTLAVLDTFFDFAGIFSKIIWVSI